MLRWVVDTYLLLVAIESVNHTHSVPDYIAYCLNASLSLALSVFFSLRMVCLAPE